LGTWIFVFSTPKSLRKVMFPTFTQKCSLIFREGLFPEILPVYVKSGRWQGEVWKGCRVPLPLLSAWGIWGWSYALSTNFIFTPAETTVRGVGNLVLWLKNRLTLVVVRSQIRITDSALFYFPHYCRIGHLRRSTGISYTVIDCFSRNSAKCLTPTREWIHYQ